MELRFFGDQCVPTVVIETLRDAGYEVWHLKDYLPIKGTRTGDDSYILEWRFRQYI